MTGHDRLVLHVDMDAFYASVEQHDNPELAGLPVVVGGSGPRAVVAAASYEVRRFGVRSAMPMREALRRCPDAIRVAPRMRRYREVSREVFAIFRRYTPEVEGLSLDEAFLDLSDSRAALGNDGAAIGAHIKADIHAVTGLTASVGIGPNKLVAKIASDLDKPDGLCHVPPDRVLEMLDPLPVTAIPGVGPRTGARLAQLGVRTVADLRCAPADELRPVFGRYVTQMQARAAGIDAREVSSAHAEKSISAEETYDVDIAGETELAARLLELVDGVAQRLRKSGLAASVVSVKIRRADFVTYTRQTHFHPPTTDTRLLYGMARKLLTRWVATQPGARVRLLGVGLSDLSTAAQLELFKRPSARRDAMIDATVDRIRRRFGDALLRRGRNLG